MSRAGRRFEFRQISMSIARGIARGGHQAVVSPTFLPAQATRSLHAPASGAVIR